VAAAAPPGCGSHSRRFAALRNQLRRPADEMPPYVEAVLSDQDVADIFAYVQALPPPPDLKTIGILAN
jgi:mono/diheme cytochrome c family protein